MGNLFRRIADKQTLEDLIARSVDGPMVIFKHSTTCSISSMAYREMASLDREIALVEVQNVPELSRAIEERTGIAHESPQAIILRNGVAVWHASHRKVTAEAVEQATRENP